MKAALPLLFVLAITFILTAGLEALTNSSCAIAETTIESKNAVNATSYSSDPNDEVPHHLRTKNEKQKYVEEEAVLQHYNQPSQEVAGAGGNHAGDEEMDESPQDDKIDSRQMMSPQSYCSNRGCSTNNHCYNVECNGGCKGGQCQSSGNNRFNSNNYCSNRGCSTHNQCYNVQCNGGCIGGRCRSANNRYSGGNRGFMCNINPDCRDSGYPYCIRGVCKATNYGQQCFNDAGCNNGQYTTCINNECTGQNRIRNDIICSNRVCSTNNQCYNVQCSGGCIGGRCRSANNRYSGGNRGFTCNLNPDCRDSGYPYCIRGVCQATNYGQYCSNDADCNNGQYTACINTACTRQNRNYNNNNNNNNCGLSCNTDAVCRRQSGQCRYCDFQTGRCVANSGGNRFNGNNNRNACVSTETQLRLRLNSGGTILLCNQEISVSNTLSSSANNVVIQCVASGGNCLLNGHGTNQILSLSGRSTTIRGITFSNGRSASNGGAISLSGGGDHTIISCTFRGNRAAQRGGAVYAPQGVSLLNCELNGNYASQCFNVYSRGTCLN